MVLKMADPKLPALPGSQSSLQVGYNKTSGDILIFMLSLYLCQFNSDLDKTSRSMVPK